MSGNERTDEPEKGGAAVSGIHAYARGVRTALDNNATAYGFSISITAAYGLVTIAYGPPTALDTVYFALSSALAFPLVTACFLHRAASTRLGEDGQVRTLGGGADLLSVAVTVAAAYGLSRTPDPFAWPATGLGTTATYLLLSGLDILLARILARHTSFGRDEGDER